MAEISKQIALCRDQEAFIEQQRNYSQRVIEDILRDTNQLFYELAQLRKQKDEIALQYKEFAREKELTHLTLEFSERAGMFGGEEDLSWGWGGRVVKQLIQLGLVCSVKVDSNLGLGLVEKNNYKFKLGLMYIVQ